MRDALVPVLLLIFTVLSLLVADLAEFAWTAGSQEKEVVFEVQRGAGFRSILAGLHEAGVVHRPSYWLILARLRGDDARLQAGIYALSAADSPWRVLERIRHGKSVEFSLTIPEGWTVAEMLKAVQTHPHIRVTLPPDRPEEWMRALGTEYAHPEGWFYPDTYRFSPGSTDLDFLRRSHLKMVELLQREWENREPDLPINTPYEALILASIVEKESARVEERPMIAAVFTERLRRGMRLETDPTVIYGIGAGYDGDIRTRDLKRDTPYNTYTRTGLPPTPIALPGGGALRAVMNPAKSDALFFVSRGDGSHVFSRSYEEHRRAVIQFQLSGNATRYPADKVPP